MGCVRNVRGDMLGLAIFCRNINDRLIDFCDCQPHADLLVVVRAAIDFLSYYPERSPAQKKREKKDPWDLPKYGVRFEKRDLSYEQLIVTQKYLAKRKERLEQTKKKLPLIFNLQLSRKEREKAAGYCVELFSGLQSTCHYYFNFPPSFPPPGFGRISRKKRTR